MSNDQSLTTALVASGMFAGGFVAGFVANQLLVPGATPQTSGTGSSWFSRSIKQQSAVVVVDPLSTGADLAHELMVRGYKVIRVFSRIFPPSVTKLVLPGLLQDFVATIHNNPDNQQKTVRDLRDLPYHIEAVFCGSEMGVELSDYLSEILGCRTNGTEYTDERRDKYLMGEAVRSAGVRAVQQARVTTWQDVLLFLEELKPTKDNFKVIIKPVRSAGSDHVYLCRSVDDLKEKFKIVLGAENALGFANSSVVVQEYLAGTEYVVDTVSRDGIHKVAGVWEYEKKPCNGADFVYFALKVADGGSERAKAMIKYQFGVLDALGIRNGPAHAEIMWTETGPCLIEVGSRPQGGEGVFIPIANRTVGYNQVQVTVDSYLDEKAFFARPEYPITKSQGLKVELILRKDGKLLELPHLHKAASLKSYVKHGMLPAIGSIVRKTVDCFTQGGFIVLCNEDVDQLNADIQQIRDWEKDDFFIIEEMDLSNEDEGPKTF